MVRFQYRVVNLGTFLQEERLVDVLGTLGANGWELVGVYDKASNWLQGLEKGFALFKRAIPDGQDPDGPWADSGIRQADARRPPARAPLNAVQ